MDPYSQSAKLIAYALIVAAIIGAFARWRYLEGEVDELRTDKAALEEQIAIRARNAELASLIAKKWTDASQKRSVSVQGASKRVYDAKKPVPPECLPVLTPLQRALDGVRGLQIERDRPPPAQPDVLPGPDTARHG